MSRVRILATTGLVIAVGLALATSMLMPASAASRHAADPTKGKPVLITYPKFGIEVWRHEGDLKKLTGAPADFKRFVASRLDLIWKQAGSKPRCAHTPLIVVKRIRTDGYAKITDEGIFPHGHGTQSCAGGGHAAIFATVAGRWHEVLGTQEGYQCSDLRSLGVPSSIAGNRCLTPSGHSKPYHHR